MPDPPGRAGAKSEENPSMSMGGRGAAGHVKETTKVYQETKVYCRALAAFGKESVGVPSCPFLKSIPRDKVWHYAVFAMKISHCLFRHEKKREANTQQSDLAKVG